MELLDNYRESDFEQMKKIEDAIINAVIPFKENTDPILCLLALVRCARVMLRAATKDAQRKLLPVLFAYLEGRTRLPGDTDPAARLWTPSRRN